MESGLVVIGLNHRAAPLSVRERFWVSPTRLCERMLALARCEGVEEVVVLSTLNRTDCVVWASDISIAANSIQKFLTSNDGLKLSEWKHFYRFFHEAAVAHVFRVIAGLDSQPSMETEVSATAQSTWSKAQEAGACGQYLDMLFREALALSERVSNEGGYIPPEAPVADAVSRIVRHSFGRVSGLRVLLTGTAKSGEVTARQLKQQGAEVKITSRFPACAQEMAQSVGATAFAFGHWYEEVAQSDAVISSTNCPHLIVSYEGLKTAMERHGTRNLCVFDLSVPRDIDPAARQLAGLSLYDLDDLERVTDTHGVLNSQAIVRSELIVAQEVKAVSQRLLAEHSATPVAMVRNRLDEICKQELALFTQDRGLFSDEQMVPLQELSSRIAQRIASDIGREIKSPEPLEPKTAGQQFVTSALRRLFHIGGRGASNGSN